MATMAKDSPTPTSASRFGVSRTHVRTLLQDAERAELVALTGQGGRLVELKPAIAPRRSIASSPTPCPATTFCTGSHFCLHHAAPAY